MSVRVDQAMAEIREVFAHYPKPRSIGHCRMCYSEEDVQRFLSLNPAHMVVNDFHPILWDGCRCFGVWKEIAYYTPWLLEACLGDWDVNGDNLKSMLLRAANEEGAPMGREERRAIFDLIQARLEDNLDQSEGDASLIIDEDIVFLGAFDGELAPLLARLAGSEKPSVRANFCLFVARQVLGLTVRPKMPARSQAAFEALLAPETALGVLLENVDAVHWIAPDDQYNVDYAFDYLMSEINSNLKLRNNNNAMSR